MPAKRPDSDRHHAIELYRSGLSAPAIAKQMGLSKAWVFRAVGDAGITRSPGEARREFEKRGGAHPRHIEVPTEDIVRRYLAGESTNALAKELGVSNTLIDRRLRDSGVQVRNPAAASLLIDREQVTTAGAKSRTRKVGWGEDLLHRFLSERGKVTDHQRPVGTRNVDLAIGSIAVEVWLSSSSPLSDPYCRERIKYLADLGMSCCYVLVARRTRVLLPAVADKIIALYELASGGPSGPRQHRVIRGCGELAATFGDDLDHGPLVPPSKGCIHHRGVNARVAD